jgi:hypothetical protein
MSEREIEQLVASGEVTLDEIDQQLQQQARREAAERDPEELPDPTDRLTVGGFGSGQGMGTERTGQEPDRPDEQGFPRTQDPEWPT